MNKFIFLLLVVLVVPISSLAQLRHTLYGNVGYTFSPDIELGRGEVKKSRGTMLTLGGRWRIFTYKKTEMEIGLAAKSVLASGLIDDRSFRAATLRMAVPIRVAVPINNLWGVSGSFVFQNNVDFRELDLRLRDKYSWRVDFLTEANYQLNDRWSMSAGLSLNLRQIPDSYFVNDPKISILFGIARRINLKKKKP